MIPYNITDRTITFFAKGRPWSVASENAGYGPIRDLLSAGPADDQNQDSFIDALLSHADTRGAILVASQGRLTLDEDNRFTYGGRELHNVWTDKILAYRRQGIPHEPIFKALEDLQRNPTEAAITRLPIFLERVGAGFLPDGRFTAFKGVLADYMDAYSQTIRNMVGDKPSMSREAVDPNPNATCSTGLHVGAIGYVKGHYAGGRHKLMYVAVWPSDVVSVPVDYHGEKMRVCAYEVIDEVDPAFLAEFLGQREHIARGYTSGETSLTGDEDESELDIEDEEDKEETEEERAEREQREEYRAVAVGDWVGDDRDEHFEVVRIDEDDDDNRLGVRDRDGSLQWIRIEDFSGVQTTPRAALQATETGEVRLQGHPVLRDGWFEVVSLDADEWIADGETKYVTIAIDGDEFEVRNKHIVEVRHIDLPAEGDDLADGAPYLG